jgi:hypothetical protein
VSSCFVSAGGFDVGVAADDVAAVAEDDVDADDKDFPAGSFVGAADFELHATAANTLNTLSAPRMARP